MADPKVGTTPTPAQAASTPAPGQSIAATGDSPPSFTPGPWTIRTETVRDTDYDADVPEYHIDGGKDAKLPAIEWRTLAVVHESSEEYLFGEPTGIHNARLIAAAPDLYRALSDLVNELPDVAIDVFREVAGNSNASALRARRSAAIKALARARGEVAQWV